MSEAERKPVASDIIARVLREQPGLSRTSNLQSAIHLGLLAASLGGCAYLVARSTWAYPAVFVWVGILQYHLVVAIHEAFHHGLFRPRKVNDLAGRWIAATISFDFKLARRSHMEHHRLYGLLEEDPDFGDYRIEDSYRRSRLSFWTSVFLRPVLRLVGIREGTPSPNALPARSRQIGYLLRMALTQAAIVALFWAFEIWWGYFAFWMAPMLVVPGALARLRTFGEHAGLSDRDPLRGQQLKYARSNVSSGWGPIGLLQRVEKLVLSPFHFNYHHEHHVRAGVPYPALPTVHRALVDAGYYLRNPDNLRRSYLATIVETLRRADEIPDLP